MLADTTGSEKSKDWKKAVKRREKQYFEKKKRYEEKISWDKIDRSMTVWNMKATVERK